MPEFKKALPVWVEGLSDRQNTRVIFQTVSKLTTDAKLHIATSCVYNLYVDDNFVAYGPARAGRGHFRKDIIDLGAYTDYNEHLITIEVQSYRVNSFYIMNQLPFLQAELIIAEAVSSFTGDGSFIAILDESLVRKVQRFDFQRPFIEAYSLKSNSFNYRKEGIKKGLNIITLENRKIIERGVEYPSYEFEKAEPYCFGTAVKKENVEYIDSRSYTGICVNLHGFRSNELEWHISREVQEYAYTPTNTAKNTLAKLEYSVFKLPYNCTGFAAFKVDVKEDTELYVIFDEDLLDGDVCVTSDECCRAVKYCLKKGEYNLKFFEVYCMQYIKFFVRKGSCNIDNVGVISYIHKAVENIPKATNEEEKMLINAAVNTYRANAVDLFMDCPSRERGGYLCDSFFTARVEYLLTGKSVVERNFLQNFLHEENYCKIDGGMVPMCYPADHLDGVYIPNWSLWLILELLAYKKRTNDIDLIEQYRKKVYGILDFHKKLENEEGLLVKIPEGVFVEWSHANELVQDINFPSNMLYTAALKAAAELYGVEEYIKKAEKTKAAVIKYSYNGKFFCDHAVLNEGVIETVDESTEICQYYAFCFDIANDKEYPDLFNLLINEFTEKRRKENNYPQICFAALFIGIPLRIEMLLKYGRYEDAYREIMYYYLPQAKKTGTLWEGLYEGCSRNHGFSSIVLYWLDIIRKNIGDK